MNYRIKSTIAGVALALVLGGLSLPAHAQTYDWRDCSNQWESAPANVYCSGVTFARVNTQEEATALNATIGHCALTGSCSITAATIGSNDMESWSPSIYLVVDPSDVSSIDICFSVSDSSYTATVRAGCDTGETRSSTATSVGLPRTATSILGTPRPPSN